MEVVTSTTRFSGTTLHLPKSRVVMSLQVDSSRRPLCATLVPFRNSSTRWTPRQPLFMVVDGDGWYVNCVHIAYLRQLTASNRDMTLSTGGFKLWRLPTRIHSSVCPSFVKSILSGLILSTYSSRSNHWHWYLGARTLIRLHRATTMLTCWLVQAFYLQASCFLADLNSLSDDGYVHDSIRMWSLTWVFTFPADAQHSWYLKISILPLSGMSLTLRRLRSALLMRFPSENFRSSFQTL